mmetsp:Transcript_35113/g.54753  ORF Transcript_35113/g.54753 Transcript_35113/m.54753 type:complete len:206 (-) Transcript_35113:484-1101(-)
MYVNAFLNGGGGTIHFGIEENRSSLTPYTIERVPYTLQVQEKIRRCIEERVKVFYPPVRANQYEVIFIPALDAPPPLRTLRAPFPSLSLSPSLSANSGERGAGDLGGEGLTVHNFIVEVHVRGGANKLYLMKNGPFCFISEYRKRENGSFIAYERRDDSVFGVSEEMALERLGDRAVTPLQTRFLDCSDFSPRWWLLEQVILFLS